MRISQVPKMDTIEPCVVCGIEPGNELDHVLFGQRKNAPKAVRDWLNSEYNIQHVCHHCNGTRRANIYKNRKKHVEMWFEADGFEDWFLSAPYKIKLTDVWEETRLMVLDAEIEVNVKKE